MSPESTPKQAQLLAFAHAIRGAKGEVRRLFIEQFLDELVRSAPVEAYALSAILGSGSEPSDISDWAEIMEERLSRVDLHAVERETIDRIPVDLLILTVKKAEHSACLRAFGIERGTPPVKLGEDCDLWIAQRANRSVAIGMIGTDGNTEAAIELGRIAALVDFKAATLVGMAAGVESETMKGDVVVATSVLAYEFARMTEGGPISRAKPYSAHTRSVQKFAFLGELDPSWSGRIAVEIRTSTEFRGIDADELEQLGPEWAPEVHTGIVLAGSRLIEDNSLDAMKVDLNDRVIAAEMEGAGFAAACDALRIPWLVVRGIADYGKADVKAREDEGQASKRGKSWQFPAAYAASALVRDFVVTGVVPLLPGARGGAA